uniref:Metalloendopeptidase n=1 Tax=Globodera rostochiensis TaxID=31243 RepID=A0A914HSU3_GLORO
MSPLFALARFVAAASSVQQPLLLLLLALCLLTILPTRAQEVPDFMLSRKDIVDKSVKAAETALSSNDFANIPEKEVDLRRLGIRVELDPTMGNKVEGDIVGWSPKGRTTTDGESAGGVKLKRNKGGNTGGDKLFGAVLFDENGLARNSIRQPYRRWPHNEIPYALSSQYGSYSRSVIAKAISEYHSKTCVRFVPRDARKHMDYVWIHPDDGCYSLVGRTGGRQPLSLDSGCIQVGTIVHELMHAVGFFHEQSRYDRDGYIQILWSNVLRGADDQFEKYSFNTIDQLGEPYDFGSIMHYGPYAFSTNGKRTIVPRRAGAQRMGQRISFSETDLRKINKLYQCESRQTATRSTMNGRTGGGGQPQQQQWPTITTSSQPRRVGGSQESSSSSDNACEDRNWRCLFWSMPMLQYCDKSESIRVEICPLSCGTCTPPAPVDQPTTTTTTTRARKSEFHAGTAAADECVDKSPMCRRISRQELCVGLLGRLFCQQTCGRC